VLEREGLPTVSLTSAIDITERIRPPRAAFLNFPLGNATGRPHDAVGQRRVLASVLRLAETAREPGAIVELPDRWPDPAWEQETVRGYQAEAHIVHETRLRSEYDGEENYALRECRDVCSLA
jgi:D-proline reductase (dithiol) PrdB